MVKTAGGDWEQLGLAVFAGFTGATIEDDDVGEGREGGEGDVIDGGGDSEVIVDVRVIVDDPVMGVDLVEDKTERRNATGEVEMTADNVVLGTMSGREIAGSAVLAANVDVC